MDAFVAGLPKAELHLHIEGTLERSLREELARRNGIAPPQVPPFHDLTSFLVGYYASMQVLVTEHDFYDLAMAYFRKARSQHVVQRRSSSTRRRTRAAVSRSRRSSRGWTGRAPTRQPSSG